MVLPFIPNADDATYPAQAQPDAVDFTILLKGHAITGVVSGCSVTESSTPAQTIDVTAGRVRIDGKPVDVTVQTNQAVSAADTTDPRFDLISINSSGTVVVTAGTAAEHPVLPDIPASSVPLATLYVPANDNTHADSQINDKRVAVRDVFIYNVIDFGAACDGVTDDTTAVQATIDAAGHGMVFVPGYCLISSALEITIDNMALTIVGNSSRTSGFIQDTDNEPIFDLSDSGTAFWKVRDMHLTWSDAQTGNSGALAFAFSPGGANPAGWGHYGWIVERCKLSNGYTGFGHTHAASTINPVWSFTIRDVFFDSSWRNTAINLQQTSAGQPSGSLEKVYIDATNIPAASKVMLFGGIASLSMRQIEVGNSDSYIETQFENCLNVNIDNYRTEGGTLSTAYQGLITVSNSDASIRGLEIQSKTITHGGYSYALRTASAVTKIDVVGLRMHDFTFTSGSFVIAECSVGMGVTVANIIHNESSGDTLPWGTSWDKFFKIENGAPESAQVQEFAANVTLNMSHGVVNVDTSGAARTVTLPDNAAYAGKNFLIRRDGTNTVTINRAGTDTFDDASTSKVLASDSAGIGIFSIGDGEWKIVATSGTVT